MEAATTAAAAAAAAAIAAVVVLAVATAAAAEAAPLRTKTRKRELRLRAASAVTLHTARINARGLTRSDECTGESTGTPHRSVSVRCRGGENQFYTLCWSTHYSLMLVSH